jgi:transcriptional regulator with XRE-family HTH domain
VKNLAAAKAFGVQLRRLRESKDLSQQELANLADVAKITVQRIENAKFTATLDVLIALSNAMGISLKEMFDFDLPCED